MGSGDRAAKGFHKGFGHRVFTHSYADLSGSRREILRQVRLIREARSRNLERDMHFIDAAYDRKVRRIYASAIWNRSNCICFSSKPFCVRRFCCW